MRIERFAAALGSWIHPVARIMDRISWLVLFAMMILTVADVLMRKLFDNSILGTVEVTELMMVIIVFFALANTEIADGHIKVDLVVGRLGKKAQARFDVLTQFICFVLFCFFTVSAVVYAFSMKDSGEVTQDLWIPIYPFVYFMALGCAMLCLVLFLKFLAALSESTQTS
jgi:TRAP-type mannitol/chloroaromatic compound transport system permease small subunit